MTKFKMNFLMLAVAVLTVVAPSLASASGTGLNTIGDTVCTVYKCIVGSTLITVIATVAIFFLGIGAFFGKVNWGLVIMVALGIAVLLGALSIANAITNGGGTCAAAASFTC